MGYILEKTSYKSCPMHACNDLILQTLQAFFSEHGEPWSAHERPISTLLAWDRPLPLSVSSPPIPVIHQNPMNLRKKTHQNCPCQEIHESPLDPLKSTRIQNRNISISWCSLHAPIRYQWSGPGDNSSKWFQENQSWDQIFSWSCSFTPVMDLKW